MTVNDRAGEVDEFAVGDAGPVALHLKGAALADGVTFRAVTPTRGTLAGVPGVLGWIVVEDLSDLLSEFAGTMVTNFPIQGRTPPRETSQERDESRVDRS